MKKPNVYILGFAVAALLFSCEKEDETTTTTTTTSDCATISYKKMILNH